MPFSSLVLAVLPFGFAIDDRFPGFDFDAAFEPAAGLFPRLGF
jgi:hypothetical protein